MATVGTFGDVVFEASVETVRTFSELQRTTAARWGVHSVLGAKPIAEFVGPETDEVSLPVRLNVLFLGGATVEDEIKKLRDIVLQGKVGVLTIGEDIFGKYYLESLSETRKYFGKRGETLFAELTLSLKEYVERK
ncbi:phage tail protein [Cloacibacillus sp.]|uniref:phage tail protein n=1 Tax=Cloacibacillus sp. TaxID=2049023 RepID=UPI0025BD245B|nr:phage tail protein [Cloacibacillus sp.]MCC8056440.1 phage tail protein [Cloacibacillus sp.]